MSFWSIFLLILLLQSAKCDNPPLEELLKNAAHHPHIARLYIKRRTYTTNCIGVYVAPFWILTSQTCLNSTRTTTASQATAIREILVCTGHGKVSEDACHQRMLGISLALHQQHNLALIETDYDFDQRFFPMLRYIQRDEDIEQIKIDATPCYAVGFEQRDTLPVVTELEIKVHEYLGECIDDHTVCVLGGEICQSDSGGPLLCGGKLVGVLRQRTDCSRKASLGRIFEYTKVVALRKFLAQAESIQQRIGSAARALHILNLLLFIVLLLIVTTTKHFF